LAVQVERPGSVPPPASGFRDAEENTDGQAQGGTGDRPESDQHAQECRPIQGRQQEDGRQEGVCEKRSSWRPYRGSEGDRPKIHRPQGNRPDVCGAEEAGAKARVEAVGTSTSCAENHRRPQGA
jgi:hypothetical protein